MSQTFLNLIAASDKKNHAEAQLLLDTNVLGEIYTLKDLLVAGELAGSPEAALQSKNYQYRLRRSRHSTILARWLAKKRVLVGALGNEAVDIISEKLASTSDPTSHAITAAIVLIVRPLVLGDLKLGALTEVNHFAKGEAADTELLHFALRDGLSIVTNEGLTEYGLSDTKPSGKLNLRGRCRQAGVAVYTPEEYLVANKVDIAEESRRFIFACKKAVREAKAKKILEGCDVVDDVVGFYRLVLLDEVNEKYAHVPRPT